jgi:hypothetical protein
MFMRFLYQSESHKATIYAAFETFFLRRVVNPQLRDFWAELDTSRRTSQSVVCETRRKCTCREGEHLTVRARLPMPLTLPPAHSTTRQPPKGRAQSGTAFRATGYEQTAAVRSPPHPTHRPPTLTYPFRSFPSRPKSQPIETLRQSAIARAS